MKIGTKYSVASTITLIIVLFIVTTFISYFFENFLIQQGKKIQITQITKFNKIGENYFLDKDILLLLNYIKLLVNTDKTIVYASVVRSDGMILAHNDIQLLRTHFVDKYSSFKTEKIENVLFNYCNTKYGEVIDVSMPVIYNGENVAITHLGFSKTELDKEKQEVKKEIQNYIFLAGIFGLIIGIISALFIGLNISRRINVIIKAEDRLAEGKLDTKIAPKGKDEITKMSVNFNKMVAKLKELDDLKRDFVASVTHELRSPVAAIESYINEMLEGGIEQFQKTGTEDLLVIKNNTMRLLRFVNDLLDTAKIESGKYELNLRKVNVVKLVENVLNLYSAKFKEQNINVVKNISDDVEEITSDEDRIVQVFVNILGNAVKFTPAGGEIKIDINKIKSDKKCFVAVSVTDNGIGIPIEQQEKIFEKFTQVKGVRTMIKGPKGTGLGLFIVKNIVELHGGKVFVESPPKGAENGTRFTFTLPC